MARKTWIQVDGKLVPKDEYYGQSGPTATILPDLPDFVSPIDSKVYSGRAGLREHCRIHDVVPSAELKGLPPKRSYTPYIPDKGLKERIIHEVTKRWK